MDRMNLQLVPMLGAVLEPTSKICEDAPWSDHGQGNSNRQRAAMKTNPFTGFEESQIEDWDWENLERLSSLQRLMCELLAKNQRL